MDSLNPFKSEGHLYEPAPLTSLLNLAIVLTPSNLKAICTETEYSVAERVVLCLNPFKSEGHLYEELTDDLEQLNMS